MTKKLRAGVGLALALAAPGPAAAAECCYTNAQYSGTCKVQPTGDETCQSILAYLNNPMASGKGYCGGTTVRGNWSEASCTAPTPTPTPSTGAAAPESTRKPVRR